jgi:penicillin-binding protein 1A
MNDFTRFSSENDSRDTPRKPWRVVLLALAGVLSAGVVVLALAALVLTPTLPSVDELGEGQLKVPLRVFGADGNLLAEFGEEKRVPVKIDAVPELLVKAILAAEDHNFYDHYGVDFLGIVRAAWNNLRTKSASQGASTITMQVARNFFLSPEKTYTRKFKEALLAFKIERELSKPEILELYINKIFLGHRAYGFAAAAQVYYGKTLTELSLPEMAMLAGLPRAPSRDNPITSPESAIERRNYVLRHMLGLGFIEQETYETAITVPLAASKHVLKYDVEAPYVAEMVRQHMVQAYDEKTYGDGFHVYTTIDGRLQRAANEALRKGLLEYDRRHGYRGPAGRVSLQQEPDSEQLDDYLKDFRIVGGLIPAVVLKLKDKSATVYTQDGANVEIGWSGLSWARRYIDENTQGPEPKLAREILKPGDIIYVLSVPAEKPKEPAKNEEKEADGISWELAQIPEAAGAMVALRPSDGAILALTGGFDFYQSSFNRVIQAERQAGSSLKPFIYSAALEKGFTAASTVSGAPIVIEDATLEDEWRPENYSKRFFGPTRLRKALSLSLNLVSVRLLRAIGPSDTVDYLERFGFDPNQLPRNLSLALGTASVTPLQMATAFTVFANGGFKIEPYFMTRIEDTKRNVLEQSNPAIVCGSCVPLEVDTTGLAQSPTGSNDARPPSGAGVRGDSVLASASPLLPTPPQHNPGEYGPNPAPQTKRYAARVLDPGIAFIMQNLLQDVVASGTGRAALQLGRKDLAGKTGTTNEYRDAWFAGFNGDLVAITWVGFDQPASLGRGEAGSRAALPIWNDFMRVALKGLPETKMTPPENVVQVFVDSETGKPADPDDLEAIEEYFLDGSQPGEAVLIDGLPTDTPPPEKIPENVRENLF